MNIDTYTDLFGLDACFESGCQHLDRWEEHHGFGLNEPMAECRCWDDDACPMIKKVSIFDLDNCICDDGHRQQWLKNEKLKRSYRFHQYHTRSCIDSPANLGKIATPSILIFTGRPEEYRDITAVWLQHNLPKHIKVLGLFMRPSKNFKSAVAVKQEMVDRVLDTATPLGLGIDRIFKAYDDRQDIVDMYIKNGIAAERLFVNA